MKIFSAIGTILFSVFATAVMSYISMATPIGPWIAPTIVLFALLLSKLFLVKHPSQAIAFITMASSIGGILATACGFSFPTLYFLDSVLFEQWLSQPLFFCASVAGLSFAAGSFGLLVGYALEQRLIMQEKLSFPIGQLIYKMISAGNQLKKAYELVIGFFLTTLFCIFQDGLLVIRGFIPKGFTLFPAIAWQAFSLPAVRFDFWPMLWAIGFVTGHVIAVPLAVGSVAKVFLVDTTHALWFTHLSAVEFVLAFCSGLVLYGAIMSFISLPAMAKKGIFSYKSKDINFPEILDNFVRIFGVIIVVIGVRFLREFNFSYFSIVFLYLGTLACIYQIAYIAGKIGLAPLGRFATFVMVPAMLLFRLDMVQTVFVATFVEMSCGVAADVLFGRKMAYMMNLDRKMVTLFQMLGLVISSLSIGVIFWYLIQHFHLGSSELFAYKSQSRALLIDVKQFDYVALLLGALFSAFLKYIKVNPMLVLGGLLMPINISLGLIFGGFLTKLVESREEWEPFWSGVFAANSIWMLFKAIFG